jgi:xanthine/uracil permease
MEIRYNLDEHPPLAATLLYGLQWFAIAVPVIVIIGKITAGCQCQDSAGQIVYLQKMAFLMALALAVQILWGHRLPIILGPSTVLLVGILASREAQPAAIDTAILCGGLLLTVVSLAGLFEHLKRLFTTRVVAVVLLLIAFTLLPTILRLITGVSEGVPSLVRLVFALTLVLGLFLLQQYLSGIWKSTLIVWAMLFGSIFYYLIYPERLDWEPVRSSALVAGFFKNLIPGLSFDPGVMIAFFICFMALSINDLGSIQSVNEILKPPDAERRISRGIAVTGLANAASGILGIIGPVNFSLSPGIIAATGCASRMTLLPAAALLCMLAFSPAAIGLIGAVPAVVIGSVLTYLLCSQVAAGLMLLFEQPQGFTFTGGLVVGLPLLLGTMIAFLPVEVILTFPAILRPVLGNGFVMGVVAALILEHGVFRQSRK